MSRARATFEFTGQYEGELSFQPGEILVITGNSANEGWLDGYKEATGEQGMVAPDYIEYIQDDQQQQQEQYQQPQEQYQQQPGQWGTQPMPSVGGGGYDQGYGQGGYDQGYNQQQGGYDQGYGQQQQWAGGMQQQQGGMMGYMNQQGMMGGGGPMMGMGMNFEKQPLPDETCETPDAVVKMTLLEAGSGGLFGGKTAAYEIVPSNTGAPVQRTSKDFQWLYGRVSSVFLYRMVPSIPGKKMFGGNDENLRMKCFENFLNFLITHPVFASNQDVCCFLYEQDMNEFGRNVKLNVKMTEVEINNVSENARVYIGTDQEVDSQVSTLEAMARSYQNFVQGALKVLDRQTSSLLASLEDTEGFVASIQPLFEAENICGMGNVVNAGDTLQDLVTFAQSAMPEMVNYRNEARKGALNVQGLCNDALMLYDAIAHALNNKNKLAKSLFSSGQKLDKERMRGGGPNTFKLEEQTAFLAREYDFARYCLMQESKEFARRRADLYKKITSEIVNGRSYVSSSVGPMWGGEAAYGQ